LWATSELKRISDSSPWMLTKATEATGEEESMARIFTGEAKEK
jgi:hypothetical protein